MPMSDRAIAARIAAHGRCTQEQFRRARWPLCKSCHGVMSEETFKHVQMVLGNRNSWCWMYLLRCTKCAQLRNYFESSVTGRQFSGYPKREDFAKETEHVHV
jgi:hypothetical protein